MYIWDNRKPQSLPVWLILDLSFPVQQASRPTSKKGRCTPPPHQRVKISSWILFLAQVCVQNCSGSCCFLIPTRIPWFNQNVQICKYYLHHTYTWVHMSFSWALLLEFFLNSWCMCACTVVDWQWFYLRSSVLVFWQCKWNMYEFSTLELQNFWSCNSKMLLPVQYLSYAVPVPGSLLHMLL